MVDACGDDGDTRARVDLAMVAIRRKDFLPAHARRHAHLDQPLRLGPGSTNSQPSTVAFMLEALDARRGQRVLDVGSGSGWTSALLGHLVGPTGRVLGVDISLPLVDFARTALARYGLPWVEIRPVAPGSLGVPGTSWDRVLVSADAGRLPEELTRQLADGGRMVLPVAGDLVLATRRGDDIETDRLPGRWAFVPLR